MLPITLKNAVLLKDMSIKAKKKNMAVSFFVLNIVIALFFLLFLLISNVSLANNESFDIQNFTYVFDGFIITISAVICIVVPLETGPAISNERERQTLDVLLTTNLSNFDIILGKYVSSVIYTLSIVVSILPFLTIVLLYGGITLLQLFAVLLSVLATAMYLSTFGIFFSSVVRKSSHAAAVNLALVFIIVIGSMFLCLTTKLTFAIVNSGFYGSSNGFTSGDWIYAVLYFNPATTVYDILDKTVGLSLGSGSSYKGMARILAEISDFDPSNFFIRYWWIVGYILQTAVGVFMLKNASRALYRVNRKKHGKKTDN